MIVLAKIRRFLRPSRQGRLTLFQVMASAMAFLGIATWVITPPPQVAQAQMIEMLVIALLMGVFYWVDRIKIITQLMILSLYVFVVVVAQSTGGIHAIALDWLGVIPSCTLFLGSVTTLVWGLVSMLIVAVMWGMGGNPEFFTSPAVMAYAPWAAFNLSGMLLMFVWFVILYEETNNRHMDMLHTQKQVLLNAQEELTLAQSHKDEFIASVSHELRTPLNAVLGFTELLRDQVTQIAQKLIDQIRKSSYELLQVISDILDFSQLQAERVILIHDKVSPLKLINAAAQRFVIEAEQKGLRISTTISSNAPSLIWVDEFRMSQVLDQLLSNAVKFTHSGEITLKLGGTTDSVLIEVRDQGIGIDSKDLSNIFDGFKHASTEVQHRYGGTGLGLTICEQLIALHGGKISVKSQLGRGTSFFIELPIESTQQDSVKVSSRISISAKTELNYWRLFKSILSWKIWSQRLASIDNAPTAYLLVMVLVAISMVYYTLTAPYEQAAWISACLVVGYMVTVVIGWRGLVKYAKVDASVMFTNLISIIGILGISLYAVGIFSPTASWLVLLAAPSLYVQTRNHVKRWLIALLVVISVLSGLTSHGYLLQAPEGPVLDALWSASGHVSILLLLIFLPTVHKMYRLKTKRALIQHNQELSATRVALLDQHKQKDQFIATVTHALRTPLNFIIGFNDLLRDELNDNDDLLKMQDMVSQSAKHLLTVIDDILDYSQMMTGRVSLRYEVFDLPRVITNAFQMFGATQTQTSVALNLSLGKIPRWVNGDVQRITQILVNLLSNAMKFTQQGSVSLCVESRDEGVQFQVIDTGVGIPVEKLGQIFERFEQVNERSHRRKGHGLGLSITRQLILAQNGWIEVDSQVGKGTQFTFWLEFELAPEPAMPKVREHLEEGVDHSKTIMVVDDQSLNRTLVKAVLQKVWPDVVLLEAEHGLHALELLQAQPVSLILMDMLMPEMDGVTATQRIRNDFAAPIREIPIIGLTANANESTRQQCLQAGMNEIIYKPFNRDVLIERIELWLERSVISEV